MTDRCAECGTAEGVDRFDLGNDLGITPIHLCDDCWNDITERCGRCGDPAPGADEWVGPYGTVDGTAVTLCPECRRSLLGGGA